MWLSALQITIHAQCHCVLAPSLQPINAGFMRGMHNVLNALVLCPGPNEAAPGARSFIEGMLLPDTTAFATEFLSQSWGYGRAGRSSSLDEAQVNFWSVKRRACCCLVPGSFLLMTSCQSGFWEFLADRTPP